MRTGRPALVSDMGGAADTVKLGPTAACTSSTVVTTPLVDKGDSLEATAASHSTKGNTPAEWSCTSAASKGTILRSERTA